MEDTLGENSIADLEQKTRGEPVRVSTFSDGPLTDS